MEEWEVGRLVVFVHAIMVYTRSFAALLDFYVGRSSPGGCLNIQYTLPLSAFSFFFTVVQNCVGFFYRVPVAQLE